jgi:ribosome biogenesis GTPase
MIDASVSGIVTSVDARGARVDVAGENLFCRIRGRLFEDTGKEKRPVAPGDRVLLCRTTEGEGAIEEVLPRRTKLSRPSGPRGDQEQVIAANVDQVAVVVSVRRPPLRPALIDRVIVAATNHGLEPLVVINKIDLGREALVSEVQETFTELGYPVFLTSATEGDGIERLAEALEDRVTVFAGHSGVGKTSILNAIEPSLELRVGEVSRHTSKGRHTTTRAKLLGLRSGGYVVDTPGIRAFGLWDLEPADLDVFFREFEPHIERCRYYDCTHSHEPGCAVREAVEEGGLREARYRAYLRILSTLQE